MPLARFKLSEDDHAEVAFDQVKDLFADPSGTTIPAPSAVVLLGLTAVPNSIVLSSTVIVSVFMVTVFPFTTRFPVTV